jgi:hypothetical protein
MRRGRLGADDGSVLPLVAVMLAMLALTAMLLVASVDVLVRRARAQAAADAGALAGAAEGRFRAEEVVEANDGVLVKYREQPGRSAHSDMVVEVEVEVRGVGAVAAAERYLDLGESP